MRIIQRIGYFLRNHYRQQQGFSLTEMAIVMGVVGAILGSVAAGTKIAENAKVNNVINELLTIAKATQEFEAQYGAYPGDMINATDYFTDQNTLINGNGDGFITTADDEDLYFWYHLSLSGLYTLNMSINAETGEITKHDIPISDDNSGTLPSGPLKDSRFQALTLRSDQIILDFTGYSSADPTINLPTLTPKQLWKLDENLDDGRPLAGMIQAVENTDIVTAEDCILTNDNDPNTFNHTYNLDHDDTSCILRFILHRRTSETTPLTNEEVATCDGAPIGTRRISNKNLCPQEYTGRILETCVNGDWLETHRQCEIVTCDGDKTLSETRQVTCPKNHNNTPQFERCTITKLWQLDKDLSPECSAGPFNNRSCLTDLVLACPKGETGSKTFLCNNGKLSSSSLGTCTPITCEGNPLGSTRDVATCPTGYTGMVSEVCTLDGSYKPFHNTCIPSYDGGSHLCSESALQQNNGSTLRSDPLTCPPGETGIHEQTCYGTKYHTTQYTCQPITCSGSPIGTVRAAKQHVQCPYGVGTAYEICTQSGDWQYVGSNCVKI